MLNILTRIQRNYNKNKCNESLRRKYIKHSTNIFIHNKNIFGRIRYIMAYGYDQLNNNHAYNASAVAQSP